MSMNREEFEQKRELRRRKEGREAHKSSDTIQDYCEERKMEEGKQNDQRKGTS